MIVLNNHAFLCKKVIRQRRALVYCNKMHYGQLQDNIGILAFSSVH